MPKATWGNVTSSALRNEERREFRPYDGPTPPNGVYCFKVKVLKKTESRAKNPQLMVGLELIPRRSRPDDGPYKGYFLADYIPVMESTLFRIVPFIDAIKVSEADFTDRTIADKDGRILSVGKAKFGEKAPAVYVMAQIRDAVDNNGNPRKEVAGYWAPEALAQQEESDDAATEEEPEFDEEEPEEEPEEEAEEEAEEEEQPDAYTLDDLEGMKLAELKAIIKDEFESTVKDRNALKTARAAIEWIMSAQGTPVGEEDEPEEEEEEEEPAPAPTPKKAPAKRAPAKRSPAKAAVEDDDEPPF